MKPFALTVGLFAIALVAPSGEAAAQNFGAIAFSTGTGAIGWSFDYGSKSSAESAALANCRQHGADCIIATWFRNACGAIAVGDGNGWGAAWSNYRNGAESEALQICRRNTSNCTVRRWACTTR